MSENKAKTATQMAEDYDKYYSMMGDQLNLVAALIPYLQIRQQTALDWDARKNPGKLEYIEHINSEIKKLLFL